MVERIDYVWAAHNGASFDLPILEHALSQTEHEIRGCHVDTLHLSRDALKKENKVGAYTLSSLYKDATGSELSRAHDALADAEATALIWKHLVVRHGADPRVVALPEEERFQAHLDAVIHQGPVPRPTKINQSRAYAKKPTLSDLPKGLNLHPNPSPK